jgi:ribonuclease HII
MNRTTKQKEEKTKLALNFSGHALECGCDEAGRGCLAGPVVAAAVILPANFECEALNDSKKLTEKQREELRPLIEAQALAWAVAVVDNREIDEINILNASILAMHRAVDALSLRPDFLIIDGNKFKAYQNIEHKTIVKGDGKYLSIAAASVLAKTHRDEIMERLAAQYPHYDWKKNKAYPTKKHRQGIAEHGPCELHRMSFSLLPENEEPELALFEE